MGACSTAPNTYQRRITAHGSCQDFSPALISSTFPIPPTTSSAGRCGFSQLGFTFNSERTLSASATNTERDCVVDPPDIRAVALAEIGQLLLGLTACSRPAFTNVVRSGRFTRHSENGLDSDAT